MISKFHDFLLRVDSDFRHPISSKVNLMEYAQKLLENAYVSSAIKGDKIIGLVALYCNDPLRKRAYIPFVAVDKQHRGQHISKSLMSSAIAYAKGKDFHIIGVHTENPVALNLYLSLGFKLIEDGEQKYLELLLN